MPRKILLNLDNNFLTNNMITDYKLLMFTLRKETEVRESFLFSTL